MNVKIKLIKRMNCVDDIKREFKCVVHITRIWWGPFLNKKIVQNEWDNPK